MSEPRGDLFGAVHWNVGGSLARSRHIRELEKRLAEAEERRDAAAEQARKLAFCLAECEEEVVRLHTRLNSIYNSRLWRFGNAYWGLLRRLRLKSKVVRSAVSAPSPVSQTQAVEALAEPVPPVPSPNRYDVICFSIAGWNLYPEGSKQLMAQFTQSGHRVFFVDQECRSEGPPFLLSDLGENIYQVSLLGSSRALATEGWDEGDLDQLAGSLDALRRDLSLGATVALVHDPRWESLAERTWRRFAWPNLYGYAGIHADRGELEKPERHRKLHECGYEALSSWIRDGFPAISIIVVTYNNLTLNQKCIESIYAQTEWPNFEVIVVDNASTDGTQAYLAEAQARFLSLHVVLNARNEGFAAAVNQGLRRAGGDFLLLLNNDTIVPRRSLSNLVRHLQAQPGIGMIGPVSNAISNQAKVEVAYDRIEDMPEWAARYMREHDDEVFSIPMLAMFCVAMRRHVFEEVGLLDERFGVGMFEDDDYSRRVRALGYETVCARDAFIHHWQRASFRLLGEREYLRIFEENRFLYEEKWRESWRGDGISIEPRASPSAPGLEKVLQRSRECCGAVVFLPSIGWRIHLVQRPHHLARTFAGLGWVVVYACDGSDDQVEGFDEIEPNLFLFRGEQAVLHRIPSPILWCFPQNYHLARGFPDEALAVYDWIDDLAVFPHARHVLETNHLLALAEAPVVVSTASRLDEQMRAVRPDALYLPNGVDYCRFNNGEGSIPDDPKLERILAAGRPIAGYYGALAEWLDYELLDEVALLRPDWSLFLIGPMYDASLRGRRLFERSNVVWAGPRAYSSLSRYLQCFDVAMIPFRINEITLATSPLKLYEYFAGGKPVVSTAIPECQAFPEVRIVSGAEELASALDAARADGRDELFRARLRHIAAENSWMSRVKAVLERVQEVSRTGRRCSLASGIALR